MPSPGPLPMLAPAWILALWALFAIALREPLRWLHGRWPLAALLGALGGPLSYAGAERLGACTLNRPVATERACARLGGDRAAAAGARAALGRAMNGIDSLMHTLALGLAASAAIALLAWLAASAARRQHRRQRLVADGRGARPRGRGRDARVRAARRRRAAARRACGRCAWPATSRGATGVTTKTAATARSARATSRTFEWKSAYLVFGLQALLAGIVSLPAGRCRRQPRALELARRRGPRAVSGSASRSRRWPMASWRASRPIPATAAACWPAACGAIRRHPNYFGEFCLWWGFGLVALAAGAWWAMVSPLLMSRVAAAAYPASRCSRRTSACAARRTASTSRAPTRSFRGSRAHERPVLPHAGQRGGLVRLRTRRRPVRLTTTAST